MKNFASSLVAACLCIPAFAGVEEPPDPPKTNSSSPVDPALFAERPYSLNGVVLVDGGHGSGVVTGHPNLFLTAAHVVYDAPNNKWGPPPEWSGQNGIDVETRGYLRWSTYAGEALNNGVASEGAFSNDIALAWSFLPFTEEEPATVDLKGTSKLRSGVSSMITGYPSIIDYTGDFAEDLQSTTEEATRYKSERANYVYATHISTGPGNSGGPVWIRDEENAWKVGGLLVSGRPSEAGLYGFSPTVASLFKTAEPLVDNPRRTLKLTSKVGSNTYFAAMAKPKVIPDGKHKWTRIPLKLGSVPAGSIPLWVRLSLTATTTHRGDLLIALAGPNGTFALVHDGEGAWNDDLVINDMDLTAAFLEMGGVVEGSEKTTNTWYLMVQDRLTEDISTITSCELEVCIE